MLRLIFFLTFCVFLTASVNFGALYPPTKGEVWPRPQQQEKDNTYFTLLPNPFQFTITTHVCKSLNESIQRYSEVLENMHRLKRRQTRRQRRLNEGTHNSNDNHGGNIKEILISLTSPCEEYPYLDMDERYTLNVTKISTLTSNSIWGILRGLETFIQLFYLSDDYTSVLINGTNIVDFPRYAHRGLLIDTSRHYIRVPNILKTLDAMAMNKMNVLHWHIVDDQSFPYQSERFPELSERGAYHPSMVYSKNNIIKIINYAKDRGIRVLPEFDIPGHTRSWGEAYPNLLAKCYIPGTEYGPMNPISNSTYKFIRDLMVEVQSIFPETYFHLGGDEVDFSCWLSNPDLSDFMQEHHMDTAKLFAFFMTNVVPLLGQKSKAIVWQEVFDEGVPLPPNAIVQTWKDVGGFEMSKVLRSGHKTIYSASWYLDHLSSGGDWESFYHADPRQMIIDSTLDLNNIIGGEACMWGEVVDDANVLSRVWPRASAVAEKLWSPNYLRRYYDSIPTDVYKRLEEQTCRMMRRGIPAQPPNGPSYCVA